MKLFLINAQIYYFCAAFSCIYTNFERNTIQFERKTGYCFF